MFIEKIQNQNLINFIQNAIQLLCYKDKVIFCNSETQLNALVELSQYKPFNQNKIFINIGNIERMPNPIVINAVSVKVSKKGEIGPTFYNKFTFTDFSLKFTSPLLYSEKEVSKAYASYICSLLSKEDKNAYKNAYNIYLIQNQEDEITK